MPRCICRVVWRVAGSGFDPLPAPAGRARGRAHWRGVPFFAGQPQVFDEAPHGRHADMQALRSVPWCTQLCTCGIGLLLHELAHMGQCGLITTRATAARVRAGGDVPGRPAPSEALLNQCLADATESRDGTW
jgi:hypothetical protein